MQQYTNSVTQECVYLSPGQIAPSGPGAWRGPDGTFIPPGHPIPFEPHTPSADPDDGNSLLSPVGYLVMAIVLAIVIAAYLIKLDAAGKLPLWLPSSTHY